MPSEIESLAPGITDAVNFAVSTLAFLSSAPWLTSTGMVSLDITAVASSGRPPSPARTFGDTMLTGRITPPCWLRNIQSAGPLLFDARSGQKPWPGGSEAQSGAGVAVSAGPGFRFAPSGLHLCHFQWRVGHLLQFIDRHPRHHFAHSKAVVGDVQHREIGV